MKKIKLILIFICALTMQSCSQESKFEDALNEDLEDQKFCIGRKIKELPATVVNNTKSSYGKHSSKAFDALVEVGLLSATDTTKKINTAGYYSMKKKIKNLAAKKYELTKKGKKYFSAKGFCFGEYEVEEIVFYTEPKDVQGITIANVKYTYAVNDIPKWLRKSENIAKIFPVKAAFSSKEKPFEDDVRMFLTSKGWKNYERF